MSAVRTIKQRHYARAIWSRPYTPHPFQQEGYPFDDDEDEDGLDGWAGSRTCQVCDGTGGDPWNDGIMPCEYCDGEGYQWWN